MKSKGFTLIETIIAIGIFVSGILSFVTLVYLSTKAILRQQDNIIIQNLAQEGIEIVRNTRDNNWLNGKEFNEGLSNSDYELNFNGVGYAFNDYTNEPLKIRNLGGVDIYTYTDGINTKFYRKITISKPDSNYIKVESAVSTNADFSNAYVLEDRLYDWYLP